MAPWLNWIEQPPPKGQVAGSNPAGVATLLEQLSDIPDEIMIRSYHHVTHSVHN